MTEISQTIKLSTQKQYLRFSMRKMDGFHHSCSDSQTSCCHVRLAAWLTQSKEDMISNYREVREGSVAKLPSNSQDSSTSEHKRFNKEIIWKHRTDPNRQFQTIALRWGDTPPGHVSLRSSLLSWPWPNHKIKKTLAFNRSTNLWVRINKPRTRMLNAAASDTCWHVPSAVPQKPGMVDLRAHTHGGFGKHGH